MPGKPFQSKLAPYEQEIRNRLAQGESYRAITAQLNAQYDLAISHNAVFSFMKSRRSKRPVRKHYYDALPPDIRESLLTQVAAVWTYDSTAIEGNSLTLGETLMVMEHGLTISGKPLKDHQEVYGHARAIDQIHQLVEQTAIDESNLFDLHKAVMDKSAIDYLRPIGHWKREENGTTGIRDGRPVYMEYAAPGDVPHLMKRWLAAFNQLDVPSTRQQAIKTYVWIHLSFVRIHPFFDGNGRMARLLANLPLLQGGFPPIVIDVTFRARYIELLWNYENEIGSIRRNDEFVPQNDALEHFERLLEESWKITFDLVTAAEKQKAERERNEQ